MQFTGAGDTTHHAVAFMLLPNQFSSSMPFVYGATQGKINLIFVKYCS